MSFNAIDRKSVGEGEEINSESFEIDLRSLGL